MQEHPHSTINSLEDVRRELYATYVSTFKKAPRKSGAVTRWRRWLKYWYAPVLNAADPTKPVLEIGCGPGDFVAVLREAGFAHTVGIDLSAEQVELAQSEGLDVEEADLADYLSMREEEYGLIVAIDLIEHLTKPEVLTFLMDVFRALRPGGVLALQTVNGAGLFSHHIVYGDLTHATIFNPSSLSQALRWAGFSSIEYYETAPVPESFKGRLRSAGWWCLRRLVKAIRWIQGNPRQQVWTENMICVCRKPAPAEST